MSFELTILGSSSAVPTSNRNLTAHVLKVHEQFFLIDCGEGTQIQIRRNKLRFGKINHIFISHLHGDHIFGLFGLVSTFSLLDRKNDLHIYAHPELELILTRHLEYFERDLKFKIQYHHLKPKLSEVIFENDHITVTTIPLKHKIPTCGFLFKEKPVPRNIKPEVIQKYDIPIYQIRRIKNGDDFTTSSGRVIKNDRLTLPPYAQRSYAYCTDTRYNEKIIPIIKDVDLLFHEATFGSKFKKQAKETYHSTAEDAARIASLASVRKLIIGHFSARYKDVSPLLDEATAIFKNTEIAEDGKVFTVERSRL